MSLSGFLRLFEAVEVSHATALLARVVREEAGADVTDALLAARILRRRGRSESYACGALEQDGCSRRIAASTGEGPLSVVAACERSPAECAPIRLRLTDCDELALSRGAFEETLATLYGADLIGLRSPGYGPLTKLGEANGSGPARDVFLAARGWDKALPDALAHRRHAARATLVLVPTATSIASELLDAYPSGGRVELAVLEDVLELRDGVLALRAPLAVDGKKKPRKRGRILRSPVRALAIPRPARWADLSVYRVSDEIVSIRVGKDHVRCTCTDLGMATPGRAPTESWNLLLLVLACNGWLTVGGRRDAVKMRVSRFRDDLCAVFGKSTDPFERYRSKGGWKARFRAFSSLPDNPDD